MNEHRVGFRRRDAVGAYMRFGRAAAQHVYNNRRSYMSAARAAANKIGKWYSNTRGRKSSGKPASVSAGSGTVAGGEYHVRAIAEFTRLPAIVVGKGVGKVIRDKDFKTITFKQYNDGVVKGSLANANNQYLDDFEPFLFARGFWTDVLPAAQSQFGLLDPYARGTVNLLESMINFSATLTGASATGSDLGADTATRQDLNATTLPVVASKLSASNRYGIQHTVNQTIHNTEAYTQHFELYVLGPKSMNTSENPQTDWATYGPSVPKTGSLNGTYNVYPTATSLDVKLDSSPAYKRRWRFYGLRKFKLEPGATAVIDIVLPWSSVSLDYIKNASASNYPGITHHVYIRSYGEFAYDSVSANLRRMPSKYLRQASTVIKIRACRNRFENLQIQTRPVGSNAAGTYKMINDESEVAQVIATAGTATAGQSETA